MTDKLAVLTAEEKATLAGVTFRFTVYTVLVTGFMLLLLRIVRAEGAEVFGEGDPIENAQVALLMLAALVFLVTARLQASFDVLCRIFALFCVFAVIREGDAFWDDLLPAAGWQLPATLVFLTIAAMYARDRARCDRQLARFMTMRAMTLLWTGFIIAIPVAQLLAHGPMFKLIMGEDYIASFKRLIEETLELLGYALILFGAVEHFFQTGCWRRLRDR